MAISAASFEFVRALVSDEAGIVVDAGKAYLVESRLAPLARRARASSIEAFVETCRGPLGAARRRLVVDALTSRETSFFRDLRAFDCLRTQVLPAVIEARRAEKRLAIWCGAASTGQEPYTVAMIIHEHFRELLEWELTLLATDPSDQALERARAGRYNQIEVNRGLPAGHLGTYFEPDGLEWQIAEPLRRMITFQALHLNRPWPAFPPLDVVLMRNAMIDVQADTAARILGGIREVLRPEGYLFLGAADRTVDLEDGFEPLPVAGSGCYRRARGVTP